MDHRPRGFGTGLLNHAAVKGTGAGYGGVQIKGVQVLGGWGGPEAAGQEHCRTPVIQVQMSN
jgi:hypothetical protein